MMLKICFYSNECNFYWLKQKVMRDLQVKNLKSGGRSVAVILALGFISIPLMVSGSPRVALTLAIGASLTAVYSCLS